MEYQKDIVEESKRKDVSEKIALKIYDKNLRDRFNRSELETCKTETDLKRIGSKNFGTQLVEPRRKFVKQIKEMGDKISTADKVALLMMEELPTLETSALIHKLSMQMAHDPGAIYFSKYNQASNCGCGCGCGCSVMMNLPDHERVIKHYEAKPYSIDPFNEVGLTEEERGSLQIKDLLDSYERISNSVVNKVNRRYFNMAREFE